MEKKNTTPADFRAKVISVFNIDVIESVFFLIIFGLKKQ
jgi:hypothetical protein